MGRMRGPGGPEASTKFDPRFVHAGRRPAPAKLSTSAWEQIWTEIQSTCPAGSVSRGRWGKMWGKVIGRDAYLIRGALDQDDA